MGNICHAMKRWNKAVDDFLENCKMALSYSPLPSCRKLAACLKTGDHTDDEIAMPWKRSGDKAFCFSHSAWSLRAVAQWRQRIAQKSRIRILLPDFFCNASIAPLRSIGVQLLFYPLTSSQTPDMDACHTLCQDRPADLFLLVHYFGQPAQGKAAEAFCRKKKVWLIEDAAHVLQPVPGVGECGDFVLYSPHKHLAAPDGAVLIIREKGPNYLGRQFSALQKFHELHKSLGQMPNFSNSPSLLWLAKRTFQKTNVGVKFRSKKPFKSERKIPMPAGEFFPHPKVSPMARRLLWSLHNTLDEAAKARVKHQQLWYRVLMQKSLILQDMKPMANKETPYLAGFVFADPVQAESVFSYWQRLGLPVSTWPDLPPEVTANQERHLWALRMRNTRIYLPVHQSIKPGQIMQYTKKL